MPDSCNISSRRNSSRSHLAHQPRESTPLPTTRLNSKRKSLNAATMTMPAITIMPMTMLMPKNLLSWSIMKNQQKHKKLNQKKVLKMKNKEELLWRLRSAHTQIESIMLKTCVPLAIESLEETKTPGSVSIMTVFSTPWECARLAIYLITTKEEPRSRERPNNWKPKLRNKRTKYQKMLLTLKKTQLNCHANPFHPNPSKKSMKISWKRMLLEKLLMKNQSNSEHFHMGLSTKNTLF